MERTGLRIAHGAATTGVLSLEKYLFLLSISFLTCKMMPIFPMVVKGMICLSVWIM